MYRIIICVYTYVYVYKDIIHTEYICTVYIYKLLYNHIYIINHHNQSYTYTYITQTCTVIDYHIPKTTNDSDQEILGARKLLANVDQIQDVLQ